MRDAVFNFYDLIQAGVDDELGQGIFRKNIVLRAGGASEGNDQRAVCLDRHVNVAVTRRRLELVFILVVRSVDLIVPDIDVALVVTVVCYSIFLEARLQVRDRKNKEPGFIGARVEAERDLCNKLISPVLI